MTALVGALVGGAAAAVLWRVLADVFAEPALIRKNYRDADVPTAGGLVLFFAMLVAEAVLTVAGAAGADLDGSDGRRLTLLAAAGFGLLGLFDDLAGTPAARGFRGHLAALVQGRVTTGGVKLLGGGAVALVVVAPVAGESLGRLLRDGALVALAANLGNLLDRAPGRALKWSLLAVALLVALAGAEPQLAGVTALAGAGLFLLVPDLRERVMLGDTGANVLGAAVGLGVVLACSGPTRTAVLAVMVVLNIVSEVVSFSRVIDRVQPLRAFDQIGRRPLPPPSIRGSGSEPR